jgi:hypothetical protein
VVNINKYTFDVACRYHRCNVTLHAAVVVIAYVGALLPLDSGMGIQNDTISHFLTIASIKKKYSIMWGAAVMAF